MFLLWDTLLTVENQRKSGQKISFISAWTGEKAKSNEVEKEFLHKVKTLKIEYREDWKIRKNRKEAFEKEKKQEEKRKIWGCLFKWNEWNWS